ncbi:MAG: class I SAM-dependent rRNA methyltransferase [Lachnospiraceae bacterium]|nr:class I SAM-dependent rRNA methyltransferase [Lachnospiraceae bacterium]
MEENQKIESEDRYQIQGDLILKKGEGRTIKSGGAWIYDNEVRELQKADEASFRNGGIVRVLDFDGYFMGYGFYNEKSKIRVRMLSRFRKDPIDADFMKERAGDAWDYRKAVIDTSSCRVIFGEADFLPGLVVDKYEDLLVFQSLALGIDALKDDILNGLVDAMKADGIRIRGIFERSDAAVRKKEGLFPKKGWYPLEREDGLASFTSEDPRDDHVIITENGIHYDVDVRDGQKTGFFLDQKENRMALQHLVRRLKGNPSEVSASDRDRSKEPETASDSAEKTNKLRVLDCFTHMGTFALNAGFAGADQVTGLDISEFAVEQASENARRNGLSDRVYFKAADVFDALPKLQEEGKQYDIVILDPPAFTKSREATKHAINGYREINIRGLKLVKNGGYLCTCSCSHFMTQELFEKMIREAARSAHKKLQQVEFRTQGPDHPILLNGDENSYYLKFFIFRCVEEK